jgi:hypothetical protein
MKQGSIFQNLNFLPFSMLGHQTGKIQQMDADVQFHLEIFFTKTKQQQEQEAEILSHELQINMYLLKKVRVYVFTYLPYTLETN